MMMADPINLDISQETYDSLEALAFINGASVSDTITVILNGVAALTKVMTNLPVELPALIASMGQSGPFAPLPFNPVPEAGGIKLIELFHGHTNAVPVPGSIDDEANQTGDPEGSDSLSEQWKEFVKATIEAQNNELPLKPKTYKQGGSPGVNWHHGEAQP